MMCPSMAILSNLRRLTSGFATTYLGTLPLKVVFPILVLVIGHGFVKNAVESDIISYLPDALVNQNLYEWSALVNIYEGISAIIVFNIVAYISEANIISRFKVIAVCITAHTLGMIILYLLVPSAAPVIYAVLVLIAVGAAGRDPPLKQFLAVQLIECKRNCNTELNQIYACRDFWWTVASEVGSIISVSVLAAKDLSAGKILLFISAIVTGVTSLLFFCGSCLYHRKKSDLNDNDPRRPLYDFYLKNDESRQLQVLPRSPLLRWLYKEMEERRGNREIIFNRTLKPLWLIPLWSTFLVYSLVGALGSTFFILQAGYLNNNVFGISVPINSFFLLQSIVSLITSSLADLVVYNIRNVNKRQLARLVRIGMGMTFSTICCFIAWHVDSREQSLIIKVQDPEVESTSMSILWLGPQYCLLGLMEALAVDGLSDFFFNHVRGYTSFLEFSLNGSVLGVGKLLSAAVVLGFKSWFGDDIKESHLARYYLMLGILNCGNLVFYCLVSRLYAIKQELKVQSQETRRSKTFPQRRNRASSNSVADYLSIFVSP